MEHLLHATWGPLTIPVVCQRHVLSILPTPLHEDEMKMRVAQAQLWENSYRSPSAHPLPRTPGLRKHASCNLHYSRLRGH